MTDKVKSLRLSDLEFSPFGRNLSAATHDGKIYFMADLDPLKKHIRPSSGGNDNISGSGGWINLSDAGITEDDWRLNYNLIKVVKK